MTMTVSGASGVTYPDSTTQSTGVLTATAAATAGAVGTYALARYNGVTDPIAFADTVSGSDLTPSTASGNYVGSALSGTWRCMGYARGGIAGSENLVTLWLRIS